MSNARERPQTEKRGVRYEFTEYRVPQIRWRIGVHAARPVRAAIMWPSATALGERWLPAEEAPPGAT